MRPFHIVITCEHGGNYIPARYSHLFSGSQELVQSHRGWDIGALKIAQKLARELQVKLFQTKISRLLVDCNRSVSNPEVFSKQTHLLAQEEKDRLLNEYYYPYRNNVENQIASKSTTEMVLHLSVHTFVPEWHGTERKVDVGLLYDDKRALETEFSERWKEEIQKQLPEKLIMLNIPYHGADDGFTTYLRGKVAESNYWGIEIEVNQKWVDSPEIGKIITTLHTTLSIVLNQMKEDKLENIK